jgi:hypothetical protein
MAIMGHTAPQKLSSKQHLAYSDSREISLPVAKRSDVESQQVDFPWSKSAGIEPMLDYVRLYKAGRNQAEARSMLQFSAFFGPTSTEQQGRYFGLKPAHRPHFGLPKVGLYL